MSILGVEIEIPHALEVHTTADTLSVDLSDGCTISVPLGWYPRLEHASPDERSNCRLIGKGQGIHWEDIARREVSAAHSRRRSRRER